MKTRTIETKVIETRKNNSNALTQVISTSKLNKRSTKASTIVDFLMDAGYELGNAIDIVASLESNDIYRIGNIEIAMKLDRLGFILIDLNIIGGKVTYSYINPRCSRETAIECIAQCKL